MLNVFLKNMKESGRGAQRLGKNNCKKKNVMGCYFDELMKVTMAETVN
jgi:hypothetical protein